MRSKNLTFDKITLTEGFWKKKQELVRKTTVWSVYNRFLETGRFEAFKLNWKEGDPNKPHIFWDSDVAKWIEGVAYLTAEKREPKLEAIVDEVVECIARGRESDGYFNSYYQQFELENRFTEQDNHELYCAGHLLEAAIAYDKATGKSKFLDLMKDYVKLIKRLFTDEKSTKFSTPGHEEIELALVKLYDYTGDRQYLDLAVFFIEHRGENEDDSLIHRSAARQDHLPVRKQTEAIGHAVRAVYLYSAMADIAKRTDDKELEKTVKLLFEDITKQKMYITGAIGSIRSYKRKSELYQNGYEWIAEAFGEPFYLPNTSAYAETCAAIGLALFARRMSELEPDSHYADTVERILYNGFLSGLSFDGKSFFYENAQEIDRNARMLSERLKKDEHFPITQRIELFDCSCCPPNIVRFIPSVADFIYHYTTDDTVFVNQYMASISSLDGLTLTQKTDYPNSGTVKLSLKGGNRRLGIRIPTWCKNYTLLQNGVPVQADLQKGYAMLNAKDGDEITLQLSMEIRFVKADPRVSANQGKTAVCYGPFVMCMEGVDNGENLYEVSLRTQNATVTIDPLLDLPTVSCPAVRQSMTDLYSEKINETDFTAKLVPYFTFGNRGESDMRIWFPIA